MNLQENIHRIKEVMGLLVKQPTKQLEAFMRGNFLRNQEDSFDKKFPCYIFVMSSIPAQAPLSN